MKQEILKIVEESTALADSFFKNNYQLVARGAEMLAQCLTAGNKVLIFGNGGSAADAQHIAAEFVNRFELERPPLAAMALTTDTSVITSISNDYTYDEVFSKQVAALGRPGDIAWGISTSGTSKNVLAALDEAAKTDMITFLVAGRGGITNAEKFDMAYCVDSGNTARVQEVHCILSHILCGLTENILFPGA